MKKMNDSFDKQGRFVLHAYDQAPPFSSFLPGIAGFYGVPMWVFYVNRGQAVSSFGIESKDSPLMEFQPANKSYQLTNLSGFRTFLKGQGWFAEPFSAWKEHSVDRNMFIGMNEVEIQEINQDLNLETRVLYFNLIGEPFAGLVRKVSFRNLGESTLAFDVMDGMPALIPYGVDDEQLKLIGRTVEAWMEVENLAARVPFFHLRASAEDSNQVRAIQSGHFAFSVAAEELLPVVVDPRLIFGQDTSFSRPQAMLANPLGDLWSSHQITEGRTPCAFFGRSVALLPGTSTEFFSIYGYVDHHDKVNGIAGRYRTAEDMDARLADARRWAQSLTDPIETHSSMPVFDAFCRQTFLDNGLRGGWPVELADRHIFHVFSRKHGDLERDYNYFSLSPEPFSQGNGNYRDINQNRRSDVFFDPQIGDFDIRFFMSLIQIDGYNPLVVEGVRFSLSQENRSKLLDLVDRPDDLRTVLDGLFTPGEVLIAARDGGLRIAPEVFIHRVFEHAEQHIQAEFGEGYWIDHWIYNLDLMEAFLNIYPEKRTELLLESPPMPFFDSPAFVNPRSRKYVLDQGQPRQYHAIEEDEAKEALIVSRQEAPDWLRTDNGQGDIFTLNLFSKWVLIAILKFATRDPEGMGIEMEAGRPSWYDALNGLPALFGSSMPESFELLRLLDFLLHVLKTEAAETALPIEAGRLFDEIQHLMREHPEDGFSYWDAVSSAREAYREAVRWGVSGELKVLHAEELETTFEKMRQRVKKGIDKAVEMGDGLSPTYFAYEAEEYELTGEVDAQGRPFIRPLGFHAVPMPDFLEGPVHQMKLEASSSAGMALHKKVQSSALYDTKLNMYKINASLQNLPFSIGRARAFSPGWLENESIWLHMTDKYLLEMLKTGLYEPFFEALKANLPAFMDPAVYGRSPLENSSFIVSSVHPDPSLHGRGFVARLSGSTAEFLSMWFIMMTGGKPFYVDEKGQLQFSLHPILPGWFFPETAPLTFRFLGRTQVRVHNPSRQPTWTQQPVSYQLSVPGKGELVFPDGAVPESLVRLIREGGVDTIEIHY